MRPEQHRSRLFQRRNQPSLNPLAIRDAFPEPYAAPEADPGVATVISVIYVTASPTFTGAVAGYSTQSIEVGNPVQSTRTVPAPSSTKASLSLTTSDAASFDSSQTDSATQASSARSRPPKSFTPIKGTTSSASVISSSSAFVISSSFTVETSSILPLTAAAVATSASVPTTTTIANDSSSKGMSGGAKAGLTLGILLAIALLLGFVLLFYRRKKKMVAHRKLHDEKSMSLKDQAIPITAPPPSITVSSVSPTASSPRSERTAPRLSLRPVTMFDPNLGDANRIALRSSLLHLGPSTEVAPRPSRSETPVLSVREGKESQSNVDDPANPFGDHAQGSPSQASPDEKLQASRVDGDHKELDSRTIPSAAAANVLPTHPTTQPVTPTPQKVSSTMELPISLTALTSAAAAPAAKPSNVHRVRLDFKPSLQDELQLNHGQLVRLLHEYDDGWALCTYLDHSAQGVAPRSCLTKQPIKPRPVITPQSPPLVPPPAARGPAQALHSGPTPRSQLRLESPVLRTAEFTAQRPTPPKDRARSNSSAQPAAFPKPVGQAVPNRKPVSGQAQ